MVANLFPAEPSSDLDASFHDVSSEAATRSWHGATGMRPGSLRGAHLSHRMISLPSFFLHTQIHRERVREREKQPWHVPPKHTSLQPSANRIPLPMYQDMHYSHTHTQTWCIQYPECKTNMSNKIPQQTVCLGLLVPVIITARWKTEAKKRLILELALCF